MRMLLRSLAVAALALTSGLAAAEPRTAATVVLGSGNLLPHPESPIRPAFMQAVAERAPLPDGYLLEATGNGGGMAFLCRVEKTLEIARRRGETALADVDFVLIVRPPTANEIAFCARQGRRLAHVKVADYRGGLDRNVQGAWLVYDADDVRPGARTAIDYILENRRALFAAKPLAAHFQGTEGG